MFKKNQTHFSCHDLSNSIIKTQEALDELGFALDIKTGHLFYKNNFIPIKLDFELVFVRHGETYGNCGQSSHAGTIDDELVRKGIKNNDKRIYQGNVDAEINQLTEDGKKQALRAAQKLNDDFIKKGWIPDLILISPLARAKDTALPFIKLNDFADKCLIHEGIKEISFGSWENRRVCDIYSDDPCHLFYRTQHALVKDTARNSAGDQQQSENFCEIILRAYRVLMKLNEENSGKKVLMFSHSMFGAACCMLLGKAQQIENGDYLAFDGKRIDGSYYTMANATPFILNSLTYNPHIVLRK